MLITLALLMTITRRAGYCCQCRDECVILVPIVAILGVVSAHTGFNHHLRYVLPALPFAFVWTSRVGRSLASNAGAVTAITADCLRWADCQQPMVLSALPVLFQ